MTATPRTPKTTTTTVAGATVLGEVFLPRARSLAGARSTGAAGGQIANSRPL